eukprot:m.13843 g.13843  ORF g.13843 m.13843 type:complete len:82 (+) comp3326_c0_seq1:1563-1808(+)
MSTFLVVRLPLIPLSPGDVFDDLGPASAISTTSAPSPALALLLALPPPPPVVLVVHDAIHFVFANKHRICLHVAQHAGVQH